MCADTLTYRTMYRNVTHRPMLHHLKLQIAILAALLIMPAAVDQLPTADAKSSTKSRSYAKAKARAKRGKHVKRGRKAKSHGHAVGKTKLRQEPLSRPSGNLWVYSENMHEEIKVQIYGEDGEFDDEALAALDHEFRCRRTREERSVDPRLYEMLSRIQDHFKGRRIHLVSGFRFQRNESSRHYHASAMDIRIPGVGIKKLRNYADSLDGGGMGIGLYPRSNFVHVDFRAPGEPSYRWVDRSGPGGKSRGKGRSRRAKRRRSPNT